MSLKYTWGMAKSVDPDQAPLSVASRFTLFAQVWLLTN